MKCSGIWNRNSENFDNWDRSSSEALYWATISFWLISLFWILVIRLKTSLIFSFCLRLERLGKDYRG